MPTDSEWFDLIDAIGGFDRAGAKLRTTTDWRWGDRDMYVDGTDAYGFSALPAGGWFSDSTSRYEGTNAYFWTSVEYDDYWNSVEYLLYGTTMNLDYEGNAIISYNDKYVGLSVRCVKD